MTGVPFIRAHHGKADYRHRHHDSGPTGAYTTPHQLHIVSVGVGVSVVSSFLRVLLLLCDVSADGETRSFFQSRTRRPWT